MHEANQTHGADAQRCYLAAPANEVALAEPRSRLVLLGARASCRRTSDAYTPPDSSSASCTADVSIVLARNNYGDNAGMRMPKHHIC